MSSQILLITKNLKSRYKNRNSNWSLWIWWTKKTIHNFENRFWWKNWCKKTSAQLQKYYTSNELINKQVIAVVNFEPKQIGKIISEVLVLGVPDFENEPVLLSPDKLVNNGGKLF